MLTAQDNAFHFASSHKIFSPASASERIPSNQQITPINRDPAIPANPSRLDRYESPLRQLV
jgi:hypothetical protein